ncbi:MAG: hypothetical protein WKF75_17135 [Singulisphaera sp.]
MSPASPGRCPPKGGGAAPCGTSPAGWPRSPAPGRRRPAGLPRPLTGRLEFVYAQLEGENPFHIFKSLNSTGVPLGQSDLIRNFAFMVPVGDQDEFDEALWKPIERRFEDDREHRRGGLLGVPPQRPDAGGRHVPPGETFEAFQRHYEATGFDPGQVAADLKRAAEWYATLLGRPDPAPRSRSRWGLAARQLDHAALLLHPTGAATGEAPDRDLAEA